VPSSLKKLEALGCRRQLDSLEVKVATLPWSTRVVQTNSSVEGSDCFGHEELHSHGVDMGMLGFNNHGGVQKHGRLVKSTKAIVIMRSATLDN
jgi:hypothetical protein